jgi:hypothetical protein
VNHVYQSCFDRWVSVVLYLSTSNTVLQSIVPDEMLGRVMGIWALIFGGMIPLGSLEAGLTADFLGTPATMAIGAVICALAALITLQVIRKTRSSTGQGCAARRSIGILLVRLAGVSPAGVSLYPLPPLPHSQSLPAAEGCI